MSIVNVFKRLTLNKWEKVDLKSFNDFYLIGIKNKMNKKDILDPLSVKKIRFEIAIETGVKNKYITVAYINLNFDDISSSDIELNKITGYTKYINCPSKFFIRANEATDYKNVAHREGKISIDVNINAQDLG